MNRRELFKAAGAGLAAGMLPGAAASGSPATVRLVDGSFFYCLHATIPLSANIANAVRELLHSIPKRRGFERTLTYWGIRFAGVPEGTQTIIVDIRDRPLRIVRQQTHRGSALQLG